jgi:RNA polymerase sigma-70 factor (ECF subfamily)
MSTQPTDPLTWQQVPVERLQARDRQAVEAWFQAYADPMYAFVLRRVGGDRDLAADVVQETFVRALDSMTDYDPARGPMLTWLLLIARNSLKQALRQRNRQQTGWDGWKHVDGQVLAAYARLDSHPLPEEVVARQETAESARCALGTMPPGYRDVLHCYYYQDQSVRQIAASQGMTEGAVKSLLHRARLAFNDAFLAVARTLCDAAHRGGWIDER